MKTILESDLQAHFDEIFHQIETTRQEYRRPGQPGRLPHGSSSRKNSTDEAGEHNEVERRSDPV